MGGKGGVKLSREGYKGVAKWRVYTVHILSASGGYSLILFLVRDGGGGLKSQK